MVNYRRSKENGNVYFFTVTLQDRKSNLLTQHINILKESVQKTKIKNPFNMLAYVILPDHIHMIWKLPINDKNYSMRWRKIKTDFSRALINSGINLHKNQHNEYDLWQRRFWEHTIQDETDLENHINYIHYNPVKHGLVTRVNNWPYSSFHYYVDKKILTEDWGGIADNKRDYGE